MRVRRALIPLLALACGLTVANLYYSQPLLDLIADAFGVSEGAATVVVTLTQIGYALGLLLLLPLGDLVENRRLATRLLLGTAASLLVAALAPAYSLFLVFAVLIGVTSVVAQILVPFAAHLAPPAQRGAIAARTSEAAVPIRSRVVSLRFSTRSPSGSRRSRPRAYPIWVSVTTTVAAPSLTPNASAIRSSRGWE